MFVYLLSVSYAKRTETVLLRRGMCDVNDGIHEMWFFMYYFIVKVLIEILSVLVYIPVMILYVGGQRLSLKNYTVNVIFGYIFLMCLIVVSFLS